MDGVINWSPGVTLEAIEEQVITKAFRFYQKNKTATAIALGISIRTLDTKLETYAREQKRRDDLENADIAKRDEFLARSRGQAQSNDGINSAQWADSDRARTEAHAERERPTNARADAGVRVEPSQEDSAKQPVQVRQRKEVQKVLPSTTTSRSTRGPSKAVRGTARAR